MIPDSDSRSDAELIDAFSRGEEKAFEALYSRYKKQLYGFLNNMMAPSEADEVFEETWLRVIEKLHKYRNDGKFSAWLFRIARNIFIDRIRKNRPGMMSSLNEEDAPDLPGHEFSPDRVLSAEEMGKEISRALSALPAEQREVFLLREQDLSFKEIAEVQKCSLNTALSRMRYAVRTLRNFLSEIDQGGLVP